MNLSTYYFQLRRQVIFVGAISFGCVIWAILTLYLQTRAASNTALHVNPAPASLIIEHEHEKIIINKRKFVNHKQDKHEKEKSAQYMLQWSPEIWLPVSDTMLDALLSALNTTCLTHFAATEINSAWHTTLKMSEISLQIGEQNPVTKQIYVKHGDIVYACDELILGVSSASKVQFLAKTLPFSTIMTINNKQMNTPLNVVEIAKVQIDTVGEHVLKSFVVNGTGFDEKVVTRELKLLATEKTNHWLWYDPALSLIYVVEKPKKLGVLSFLEQ